jgi:hypothetical protein
MILLILIAFLVHGFITGTTHELIKLIKLIIPLFIVFYCGGYISRFIFNSFIYKLLTDKLPFLLNINYFNTFFIMIILIFVFAFSYVIITYFVNIIQKHVQTDVFTFKLGKFDHLLGSLVSIIRFYSVMSFMILPFYLLNLTTKNDDFMTKIMIDHPPVFSEIGQAIQVTEPVINSAQAIQNINELFNIDRLKSEKDFVVDIYFSIETYRNELYQLYVESGATNILVFTEPKEVLYRFLVNSNLFVEAVEGNYKQQLIDKSNELAPISGLLLWANELGELNEQDVIEDFNQNYQVIISHTQDLEMLEKLSEVYDYALLYFIVNEWFIQMGIDQLEANLQIIIERLIIEFDHDKSFIINEIYQLKQPKLTEKLNSIKNYLNNYDLKYRDLIENMEIDLEYKYKIIAATLINFDFKKVNSPLISLAIIDTLEMMNKKGLEIIESETIYQTIVKIMIPVYFIHDQPFTEVDMTHLITEINQGLNEVYLTEEFVLLLIDGFILSKNENEDLYINDLINSSKLELSALEILLNSDLLSIHDKDSKEIKKLKTNIIIHLTQIIESGDIHV